MKTSTPLQKAFILLFAIVMLPILAQAAHVYVTPTGAGNHSGTSWGNASNLGEALWNDEGCNCHQRIVVYGRDEVWLKQGTYGQNLDRPGVFVDGIKLYGGFAGNETNLTQRNPILYKTILSGFRNNINFGGFETQDAGPVVPLLDGITIQNSDCIFNIDNVVNNCIFQGCRLDFSSVNNLTVTNSTFENSGGMSFSDGNPSPVFTGCIFRNLTETSSTRAAVIDCEFGGTFRSCVFDSNYSHSGLGGAIYSFGKLTVENCLFTNNGCAGEGGAIFLDRSSGQIFNNTFINNYCAGGLNGNAIYDDYGNNTIANNIMWGSNNGASLFYLSSLSSYSDVLSNNITMDGSGAGFTFDPQLDSNYALSGCSRAINAGNNSYTDGQTTDLAGNTRIVNETVDIGCYEHWGAYLGNIQLTASATSMCDAGIPVQLQYSSSYTGPSTYYWNTNHNSFVTTEPVLTVYPTSTATDYYVNQVTGLGCINSSPTVHISVYPALVGATTLLVTPASSDTICVGQNVSVTAQAGSGGSPGCTDYFRYCTDGGSLWQTYVPGANINTSAASGSVIVQTRRGGCTNCPYTNWGNMVTWPVKQTIAPTLTITGSNVLQQGQPATFSTAITYGGNTPVYSWALNGHTVGTNAATYTVSAPANGDILICTLTSNYTGCLGATVASDTVTLSVGTDYITSPDLCINQPMTVHFGTNPSVVYWQHYSNSADPDTAYATWEQSSTTVVNGTGVFGGICTDAQSNVYVADFQSNVVRKFAPGQSTGVVVAGNIIAGAGSAANQLNDPADVFVDASGNLYVLDALNYRVQKWAPGATTGVTVAGGNGRGIASNQFWSNLNSMTVTSVGNIYVADPGNGRVQMWAPGATSGVTAAGNLSSVTAIAVDDRGTNDTLYIAGASGSVLKWPYGASSGVVVAGGNGIGPASNQISGYIPHIYRNVFGDIYIADRNNGRIQLWRHGATAGITVAGVDGYGYLPSQLGDVVGLALNSEGDIYISQAPVSPGTAELVKFASQFSDTTYLPFEAGPYSALVFTFTGSVVQTNTLTINDAITPSVSITTGNTLICPGSSANFIPTAVNGGNSPLYKWYVNGILAGSSTGNWVTGNLHAGDSVYCVLTSSEACLTSNTAGSNTIGMKPFIVSVDIVAQPANAVCQGEPVRFISRTQNGGDYPSFNWLVNNIIYGNDSIFTYTSPANNDVVRCVFTSSSGCTTQPADTSNSITVKVSSNSLTASGICAGSVLTDSSTLVPSLLQWLRNDSVVRNVIPQWSATGTQLLSHVYGSGIFRDGEGNIYLSDALNYQVKKYAPGDTTGIIVAGGNGQGFTGNQMYIPGGIYVDTMGNIYVCDYYRVSKWSAEGVYLGNVAGNNSPGTGANQFNQATNVYIDKSGNLYVCDAGNERVQKFTPGSTNGITVAGGNGYGNAANQITNIQGVDVDAAGNVYVADYGNDRVQKWAPGATAGITVAGGNGRGTAPNQLWAPVNVHVDGAGNIFVMQANGAVALWVPGDAVGTTILSGTNVHASAINSTGDIFIADINNDRVVQYHVLSIADTFTANTGGAYKARILNFSGCSITTDADTIYDTETPSLSIVSDQGDTVCSGKLVTFSATALNASPSPVYLWTKNSLPVGDSTNVYLADYVLQNDTIKCSVLANNVCLTTHATNSNKIVMSVRGPVYGSGNAFINPGDTLHLGGQVIADSGTYVLTMASVYDCDSIVTTHFSLCAPIRDTVQQVICSGDSVLFNGQMLSIAGNYSNTLQNINGCDSIITLTLTVMPNYNYTFSHSICNNESFAFGGQLLTTAGTYTDTLATQSGCDSIVTVNLSVLQSVSSTVSQSTCAGSPYNFNGHMLSVSGSYHDTLTSMNGCDSIVTLNLTVKPVLSSSQGQSICIGSTYTFNGQMLSASGSYYDTLTSTNGCDSIITLNLTVRPVVSSNLSQSICAGSTYTFNGQVLNTSGAYYDTLTAASGCDSIVTLNLTVRPVVSSNLNQSICTGSDYNFNGQVLNTAGTYKDTLTSVNGCDSIVTLNLTISNQITGTDVQTACGSYTWIDGNTYTSSNPNATYTLTGSHGCDSVVTLNLTINHPTTGTDIETACGSYTWIDGNTYTASNNTATFTLQNVMGCDSVVTLNLIIHHSTTGTDIETACGSYTWIDGNTYIAGNNTATYTLTGSHGCDSVVTLNLTINHPTTGTDIEIACGSYTWIDGNTYTASNNTATFTLQNVMGCDSVVTLNLIIHHSTTGTDIETACSSYTWIDGNTYANNNNTATFTLQNAAGCDSVVTLNLAIHHSTSGTDIETACGSYTWIDGNTYTASNNTATYTLTGSHGCDSVVTLNLTINHPTTGTDVKTACGSYTWIDGNTYTSSNTIATYTLTGSHGCDSVVTLNLTINHPTTVTDVQTACGSYTWIDGNTYTASNNTATYTLTGSHGCDSIVTLNLTINHPTTGIDVKTACGSYTWIDGNTYTASNNTATYTLTGSHGCDSVVTLNLTITTHTTGTDVQTACGSYTWIDGNTYTASNNTATYTLTGSHGCDSVVTLNLTITAHTTGTDVQTACGSYTWIDGNTYTASNNTATFTLTGSHGCDSVVTLNLTINHPTTGTDVQTACGSYTWIDGNTYTASNNTATYTLSGSHGCDSVVTLNLSINHPTTVTDVQTACGSYTWIDGNTYTASNNTATYTWTGSHGCDSVVTLNLTITTHTTGTDVQTACGSYTWIDGNTYTASNNTATYTWTGSHGCDSVVTLNLTITTHTTGTDVQTACGSYTWIDGNTYTASNNTATYTLTGSHGCDSVVTLNLTITTHTTGTDVKTACGSYTWIDGNTYTASNNTATFTLTGSHGCDSVLTLNLTINHPTTGTDVKTACGSYTWIDGNTYTGNNNTATFTLQNAAGCDSVVTLNLTINNILQTQVSDTICNGMVYQFNGHNLLQSGIYKDTLQAALTGCDSVVTLHLIIDTVLTPVISQNGDNLQTQAFASYQWFLNGVVINGANSQNLVVIQNGSYSVQVTGINGCSDTSATLNVTTLAIKDIPGNDGVKLYPNPNSGNFILQFTDEAVRDVEVVDAVGRIVMTSVKVKQQQNFNLEQLSAGIYFVRINQSGEMRSLKFTLVK